MPPVFGQWARPVARFKPASPSTSHVVALALPVGRWLHYQREWAETCVRAARVMTIPGHGPGTEVVPARRPVGDWDEALEMPAIAPGERDAGDDAEDLLDIIRVQREESAHLSRAL